MPEISQIELDFTTTLESVFGVLDKTIHDLLLKAANEFPNRAAILDPDRPSLTYAALVELVDTTVQALNSMGLRRGCRIAAALPISAETATLYLSVLSGMTLVPLNHGLPEEEYTRLLRHARCDAVIVQQGVDTNARAAVTSAGIRLIELVPICPGPIGVFRLLGAIDAVAVAPEFAAPEDVSAVLTSSGTTSLPKLIPRTQRALVLHNYAQLYLYKDVDSVAINLWPMYHWGGFTLLILSLILKRGYYCLPQFDINKVYQALAQYRAQMFAAVPPILQVLVSEAPRHQEEIAQFDLKMVVMGSTAPSATLVQEVRRVYGAKVQIGYGLTEVTPISNIFLSADDSSYKAGSVGRPVEFIELRILEEEGIAVSPGETGEIVVRSPLVFTGYENDTQANNAAFIDGWFRTGDVGNLDADGYLYLSARLKEVINRGGSKVSPLDVDAVLLQHPAVLEAAAFGFPHAALGEDVAAAIVSRDALLTEQALRLFVSERLLLNQVPSRIIFVDELPKTALGKVKRAALAEQFKVYLRR